MIWLFTIDKIVQVKFNTSLYTGKERDGVVPVTVVATGVASFPYTIEIRPFAATVGDISEAQPGHDFDNKTIFITLILNPIKEAAYKELWILL